MDKKLDKKLVLSGAGALLPVQTGGMSYVCSKYNIIDITGSSAGSFNGALVAVGYNNKSIEDILFDVDLNNVLDYYFGQPLSILDNKKMAILSGDKLYRFFLKVFSKNGVPLKFEDVKIPLTVTATNIDKRKLEIFSNKITPTMEIALAVRMSLSIPGIFTPITYNGCKYVDGGLMKNFFIDNYNENDKDVIGIRIFDNNDFDPIKNAKELFFASMFSALLSNAEASIKHNANAKILNLIVDFDFLNFNGLKSIEIQRMYLEGYQQAKEQFER